MSTTFKKKGGSILFPILHSSNPNYIVEGLQSSVGPRKSKTEMVEIIQDSGIRRTPVRSIVQWYGPSFYRSTVLPERVYRMFQTSVGSMFLSTPYSRKLTRVKVSLILSTRQYLFFVPYRNPSRRSVGLTPLCLEHDRYTSSPKKNTSKGRIDM